MLPDGWKRVKIEDIFEETCEKNHPDAEVLTIIQGVGTVPREQSGREIVYDKNSLANYKFVKKGDFIIHLRSFEGGLEVANSDGIVSPAYIILHPKIEVSTIYLYALFHTNRFINQTMAPAVEGARDGRSVKYDVLKKQKIPFPPLSEQKKIAATLSVWDSAIEKMEKLIEAKENAKQFFFYKLVTENSCLWEIKKLSDFLTPGNKTPVLNTSLYRKMIVKLHKKGLEFNTQTREMADTRPFYIRNEGELIIGKQNYFNGSIAMVDKEHDQCICSNAIMSFSIKDIHPLYLYEYISDEEYLKKHSMLANGTGQKELSEKDFLNFEIRVPKRKQQDEIACVLNNCSLEIFLLHAQLENYKKQKQGLMQKLLTGQWRVK